jgi:hypothetical protein
VVYLIDGFAISNAEISNCIVRVKIKLFRYCHADAKQENRYSSSMGCVVTGIISLTSINKFKFVTVTCCVFFLVRTEFFILMLGQLRLQRANMDQNSVKLI